MATLGHPPERHPLLLGLSSLFDEKDKIAKMDSIQMEGCLWRFKKQQACVRKPAPLFFFKSRSRSNFRFCAEFSTTKQYYLYFVLLRKSVPVFLIVAKRSGVSWGIHNCPYFLKSRSRSNFRFRAKFSTAKQYNLYYVFL